MGFNGSNLHSLSWGLQLNFQDIQERITLPHSQTATLHTGIKECNALKGDHSFVMGRKLLQLPSSSAPACWGLQYCCRSYDSIKFALRGCFLQLHDAALLERQQQHKNSFISPYNQNKLFLWASHSMSAISLTEWPHYPENINLVLLSRHSLAPVFATTLKLLRTYHFNENTTASFRQMRPEWSNQAPFLTCTLFPTGLLSWGCFPPNLLASTNRELLFCTQFSGLWPSNITRTCKE